MVKRYDIECELVGDRLHTRMVNADDGDYVTYDDYKKLAEENSRLRLYEEIYEDWARDNGQVMRVPQLVEKLRAEIVELRSVVSNHRLRHYKEHSTGWDWGMVDAQELIDAVPKTEETK